MIRGIAAGIAPIARRVGGAEKRLKAAFVEDTSFDKRTCYFSISVPQQQVGASLPASSAGAPLVTLTSQPQSVFEHL
ncbi:MAG: hypothetical protein M3R10_03600 [Verrucomicrobiota bacterium]|nr:hypothetical protein [Verrucomicrobiota bacterium]